MNTLAIRRDRLIRKFRLWARRVGLNRKLAFSLAVAAVVSGLVTVAAMTGTSAIGDPSTVLFLLYLDLVLLLLLGAVVARRLVIVWAERRRGMAGSGLLIRFVMLFSLVAVTPAILVAVFAGIFLNFGIESWFSDRVRTAISESKVVAEAYLYEHQQNIRADAFAMANDLNRMAPQLMRNPGSFNRVLSQEASLRNLPEALVIDRTRRVLARSRFSLSLEFDLVPPAVMEMADRGEIALVTNDKYDRVRAVIRLNRFLDAYLLVGRFVEAGVLERVEKTRTAVAQYQSLEKKRGGIQITFVMIFVVVALLLLLAAVWLGLTIATQMARPLSSLIAAAERVRKGDLSARVSATSSTDEIGMLGRAFNRMTSRIERQQQGLIEANRELDERRRFTETVLSGVSAGVIGLDEGGRINLPNRSASELLGTNLEQCIGRPLGEVVPEMAELVENAISRPAQSHESQIKLTRRDKVHTLLARAAAEELADDVIGYVVTFDDVTDLLSAQRTAAWADVARRIAHEIKNPLTPIQLSAERLKRRYLKQITTDSETFSACTDTIVRQVKNIGRMVDEFSSFARMPQPKLKAENLSEICRQSIFLERNRFPSIKFVIALPDDEVEMRCDHQQISRVLTNVLKNAAESIIGKNPSTGKKAPKGHVWLTLDQRPEDAGGRTSIVIEDTGAGLPAEHREHLTEPYVSTRDKGTGLGLAIVKKIMEDHGGDLLLEDREEGGARVILAFHPLDEAAASSRSAEAAGPESTRETTRETTPESEKIAPKVLSHGL